MHNKIFSTFQAAFMKGKKNYRQYFATKTINRRYLRIKKDCVYSCLVDLKKPFTHLIGKPYALE
jgi:hypothetical protein